MAPRGAAGTRGEMSVEYGQCGVPLAARRRRGGAGPDPRSLPALLRLGRRDPRGCGGARRGHGGVRCGVRHFRYGGSSASRWAAKEARQQRRADVTGRGRVGRWVSAEEAARRGDGAEPLPEVAAILWRCLSPRRVLRRSLCPGARPNPGPVRPGPTPARLPWRCFVRAPVCAGAGAGLPAIALETREQRLSTGAGRPARHAEVWLCLRLVGFFLF